MSVYTRYDRQRAQRQQIENEQREMGKAATFYFSTPALKELWDSELVGQISDGMWENTNGTGWVFWCNINTEVGPNTCIEGRVPYSIKRNFAFARLFEYVGDRIMETVQKHEPNATEKQVRSYMREITNAMKATAY